MQEDKRLVLKSYFRLLEDDPDKNNESSVGDLMSIELYTLNEFSEAMVTNVTNESVVMYTMTPLAYLSTIKYEYISFNSITESWCLKFGNWVYKYRHEYLLSNTKLLFNKFLQWKQSKTIES